MQADRRAVKNILLLRNDRFGEFLLNIPAFRALKETFVSTRLIALINPYVRELAEGIPFIDEVIEWDNRRHSLFAKLKLINMLRKKKIDIAVMLNPSQEFNIFSYLAGIPIRIGYARKWGFSLTHKMEDKKYLGEKHEIEYNLELVGLIGAKTKDNSLSLLIDDRIVNNLFNDSNIKNYDNLVAIHPFTSDPIKQWPLKNFGDLAKRLAQEQNIKVITFGDKNELTKSKEFCNNLSHNIINVIGRTTLRQLAALLKRCKLLISGDSGPVHLASCAGTPVVAIFRNDLPGKTAKRWGPWGEGHIVIERSNLCDISVDEVFNRVKEALNK